MKKPLVYLLLILCTALWGSSFVFTKEIFDILPSLTPPMLITLRIVAACLMLFPILALTNRLEKIRKQDIKWFLLLSFCEPFIYNFCEASGVQLVSSSLTAVIIALLPLIVPFAMATFYKEKIRISTIIGIVLSIIGITIMLSGDGKLQFTTVGLLYLAAALVVAVAYMIVLAKVVDNYRPVTVTAYQNLFALIFYLPTVLLTSGLDIFSISFTGTSILYILILGLGCSALAYIFYNYGIRNIGVTAACIFYNTTPIFTLIVAVALGQETFSVAKCIGIVVVVSGVIIAQLTNKAG